jgi:hypothetical protein
VIIFLLRNNKFKLYPQLPSNWSFGVYRLSIYLAGVMDAIPSRPFAYPVDKAKNHQTPIKQLEYLESPLKFQKDTLIPLFI